MLVDGVISPVAPLRVKPPGADVNVPPVNDPEPNVTGTVPAWLVQNGLPV